MLLALIAATSMSGITLHNASNCCCQNIYPRSEKNLVDTVTQCIENCRADAACHAAIFIVDNVRGQCQLKAPPPPGKACCIHKPHFDQLTPYTAGPQVVIDMGTSTDGGECQCCVGRTNCGWGKPCAAPLPEFPPGKAGSCVQPSGPCTKHPRPPTPPPPPYELHRPIYHLTPEHGHNNDPNGMFYDPMHKRYHVFVQWAPLNPASKLPTAWYHFSSPQLAGPWKRYPLLYTNSNNTKAEVAGCSGGATLAPDGMPTLVICGGATAVPANRSDPLLTHWIQNATDLTKNAYFPENIPGKWDCSVYREPSGRYRVTFGSCAMFNGTVRPHQGEGYCNGGQGKGHQDGLPQVLSYVS